MDKRKHALYALAGSRLDVGFRQSEDVPVVSGQVRVLSGIGPLHLRSAMPVGAVTFHDQPQLREHEIRDERAKPSLALKIKSGVRKQFSHCVLKAAHPALKLLAVDCPTLPRARPETPYQRWFDFTQFPTNVTSQRGLWLPERVILTYHRLGSMALRALHRAKPSILPGLPVRLCETFATVEAISINLGSDVVLGVGVETGSGTESAYRFRAPDLKVLGAMLAGRRAERLFLWPWSGSIVNRPARTATLTLRRQHSGTAVNARISVVHESPLHDGLAGTLASTEPAHLGRTGNSERGSAPFARTFNGGTLGGHSTGLSLGVTPADVCSIAPAFATPIIPRISLNGGVYQRSGREVLEGVT